MACNLWFDCKLFPILTNTSPLHSPSALAELLVIHELTMRLTLRPSLSGKAFNPLRLRLLLLYTILEHG